MMPIVLTIVFIFGIYYFFFSPKSQYFGRVIWQGPEHDKSVALSFDDGPNEPYTSELLELLKKHNIKATFFVVGENALRFPEPVKKMIAEGHIIGNHSLSHNFLIPIFDPYYKAEISETQDILEKFIGQKPALFRPPWFFRQSKMLKTASHFGLTTVTGTFASPWEVFQINSSAIARKAVELTGSGTILVFHDGYNNSTASRHKTIQAVELTIKQLLEKGYKFVTIPELLNIPAYQ